MKQRLYLSTRIASESMVSKDAVESLAFAVLVKLTFVDSVVRDASVRRCKELFGIGSTRMCRILKNGVKLGYLSRVGDNIVANSIRYSKDYHVTLDFEFKTCGRNGGSKCQYRLNDIVDLIRRAVLLNHISKQTDCADTINRAENPETVKEYRVAEKKIKRMLRGKESYKGLSLKRMTEMIGVGVDKARVLIDKLVAKGMVKKERQLIKTDINPQTFCAADKALCQQYGKGYLFKWAGYVYLQLSNHYTYSADLIRFCL